MQTSSAGSLLIRQRGRRGSTSPEQPVHPSQDSSETAKELVRAAAYTLDAETFRSVQLAVVCPPRGAGRHREGADQADRDRGAESAQAANWIVCIPP